MEITSAKNERYKRIKSLQTKKARDEFGVFTVEGIKSVCDAIDAKAKIKTIITAKSFDNVPKTDAEYITVPDEIFSGLCDTKTPQGILAVIEKNDKFDFESDRNYIFCDNVRDPGNLGTIIRTANATGFGVLLSQNSVELYSPKVVRSSMGSFFRTEIVQNVSYERLKSSGLHIIGGALSDDSKDFRGADYKNPVAIVVGNEANGISDELMSMLDEKVIIPICGGAESLNVAVAAAILMYEAVREKI